MTRRAITGANRSPDQLAEQQSSRCRQERNDDVQRKTLGVGIGSEPAQHHQQSRPEFPAHSEDGAGLEHNFEHLGLIAGVDEERAGDDQMTGARNRQKLGQSLDDAED
jgi:hypothetical protein